MPPLDARPLLIGMADGPVLLPVPVETTPGARQQVPDYIACGLALRTLALIGRLKRKGRELRRKRLSAELSKGALGRLCGVSARQMYRWESGEAEIPAWVWERIGGTK